MAVHPQIHASLDSIIHRIIHMFVDNWYSSFDVSQRRMFQRSIYNSLHLTFTHFGFAASKTHATTLILMYSQAFLLHFREYRKLEKSGLSLIEFRAAHPDSPFNALGNLEQMNHKLLDLAMQVLIRCMAPSDKSNLIVLSFVHELLGTSILRKLLQQLGDPDFINQTLLELLTPNQFEKAAKLSKRPSVMLEMGLSATESQRPQTKHILSTGENLFEFMDFMKKEKSFNLLQFCFLADSFKRLFAFAKENSDTSLGREKMRNQALEIFDCFFSSAAADQIHLKKCEKVIAETKVKILESTTAAVFDPLVQCIYKKLDEDYLPKFIELHYFESRPLDQSNRKLRHFVSSPAFAKSLRHVDRNHSKTRSLDLMKSEMKDYSQAVASLSEKLSVIEQCMANSTSGIPKSELVTAHQDIHTEIDSLITFVESNESMLADKTLRNALNDKIAAALGRAKQIMKKLRIPIYGAHDASPAGLRKRSVGILKELSEIQIAPAAELAVETHHDSQAKPLTKAELDSILDCAFSAIEEIFQLATPSNWLRNQGLYLIKTVLRKAYGHTISETIQSKLAGWLAEEQVAQYLDQLRDTLLPEVEAPERTMDQKERTKHDARASLLNAPRNLRHRTCSRRVSDDNSRRPPSLHPKSS